MNLIDFNRQFPNEEACRLHLKAVREQQGVVCSKCGHTHHYWKGYRNQWQCKFCYKFNRRYMDLFDRLMIASADLYEKCGVKN